MANNFRRNYLTLSSNETMPRSTKRFMSNKLNKALDQDQEFETEKNSNSNLENLEQVTSYTRHDIDEPSQDFLNGNFFYEEVDQSSNQRSKENLQDDERDLKTETSLALYKLYIKNNMTKISINNVIKLIKIFTDLKIPCSIDKITEFITTEAECELKYTAYDYCHQCSTSKEAQRNQTAKCIECGLVMAKFFHIKILEQLRQIFQTKSNQIEFSDIKKSNLYSKIKLSQSGPFFTFTLNTDGISPFKSSKICIWPIYLVINELNIKHRFNFSNVILAGLYVGTQKPSFVHFFEPVIKELKSLAYGEK
ncbi:unnamed protein product [Brachionus calyciflorus]|uniref:Uncharacterized protein n=1 Tax=Brachionus calyciflorus TaxID=104777 RepID=A0A814Q7P9_9BILA|nr:unnamed protein product [Brachionus calyciflorus]